MKAITRVLRAGGGLCRTADLVAAGVPRRSIEIAVASGLLERIRQGVYADRWTPVEAKRAVRVGGRVACISATRLHGLRVLNEPAHLHVGLSAQAARLRHPDEAKRRLPADEAELAGVRLHWAARASTAPRGFIEPLEDCLVQMFACLPALDALCVLDSAREAVPWRGGPAPKLDDDGFARLLVRLPAASRAIAERSSTLSQAVGETVARIRLDALGLPVRAQAALPGGYQGDLLVGERLIVEIEGEGPHSAPGAFERDRRRTAWLRAAGYAHVAFSHRQVLEDWASVESVVRLLVQRGVHLWGDGLERPA